MTISTLVPLLNPVMIFDSSNPSPADLDLGTPNQDFDGLGVGNGGMQGTAGENDTALGNVLIVSADGNSDTPNDSEFLATMFFIFDNPTDVSQLTFLDVADDLAQPLVTALGLNREILTVAYVDAPSASDGGGDNGVFDLDVYAEDVSILEITFPSGGALASISFCEDPPEEDSCVVDVNVGDVEACVDVDDDGVEITGTAPIIAINHNCSGTTCNFWATFDDTADNGWVTNTVWDFGDGTTSSNGSSNHTFAYGQHTITLSMTDNDGMTSTATLNLSFEEPNEELDPQMTISAMDTQVNSQLLGAWDMSVTITVVDASGNPVQGVSPRGQFTGVWQSVNCTTDVNGQCTVESGVAASWVNEMTLNIWWVDGGADPYNQNESVTSVTEAKP